MIDPVWLALALVVGFLLGASAGARAGLRLAARRRAALGAHAQLARLWPTKLPARSATDILAGIIRVVLGGITYELPVLPRAASRKWVEALDARFAAVAGDLEKAGDDTPTIMARLVAEADGMYDMLLAYDRAGASVLPAREDIDETATDTEILRAMLEVWRAVHPLAATLADDLAGETAATRGAPSARLITPQSPMAGAQQSSSASPTSSSLPTSTAPRIASSATAGSTSNGSSKASGSGRASSTTRGRTRAGGPGSSPAPRRSRAVAAEG